MSMDAILDTKVNKTVKKVMYKLQRCLSGNEEFKLVLRMLCTKDQGCTENPQQLCIELYTWPMMDVVKRTTFGGHVAQVNLLVLYLYLKEAKLGKENSALRDKHEIPNDREKRLFEL